MTIKISTLLEIFKEKECIEVRIGYFDIDCVLDEETQVNIVIARFISPLVSCTEGLFHFPMQTLIPFLMNPELKIYIFPHICTISTIHHVYT
jgi:hypothetical protein